MTIRFGTLTIDEAKTRVNTQAASDFGIDLVRKFGQAKFRNNATLAFNEAERPLPDGATKELANA